MSKSIAQYLEQRNNRLSKDIFIGETPPVNPEEGTIWYKPSEDRYYGYVPP